MIEIDWPNVRMMTIEGTTIHLLIGETRREIIFESPADLSATLRKWAADEDRVLRLLDTDQERRREWGI